MANDDVTRPVATEAPTIRVLSVSLLVVDGPSRGTRIALPEGVARVGTARGNELRLADPTVSRVHCELRVKSGTVLVRDCGMRPVDCGPLRRARELEAFQCLHMTLQGPLGLDWNSAIKLLP